VSEELKKKRILGDLRIFQAVFADLGVTVLTHSEREQAYYYKDVDPYEFEDDRFPVIVGLIKNLISQEVLKGQIKELQAIPNFELPEDQADAVNHIVDRISELKDLLKKEEL